jgi:hypothetical protein
LRRVASRTKWFALGCTLALALPASAARAADPVRLAGTTVVTGSRDASLSLVLARPATVRIQRDVAHSDDVGVTGAGRVAGFDLRAENGSTAPPHLMAMRTNGCYTPRCAQREHIVTTYAVGFPMKTLGGGVTQYTLPSGRYRLLLVADSVPVTVTLRLGGPAGATTLRPTGRAAVSWQALTPNVDAGPEPMLFAYSASAGALPVGARGGVLFTVFDVRVAAGDFGERGFCYYPGPPADHVYVVGCPGAQNGGGESITGPILVPHTLRALQILDGPKAAAPGSTGLYYDSVGAVESIAALSLRIAY